VQANCPQCGNRLVIDDAKVPDRPFSVKCPKCQTAVKFPGKGAAAAPPPAPVAAPPAPPETPPAAAASAGISSEELRAQVMAQLRREMSGGEAQHTGERALVALPDRGQAGSVTLTLTRQGYGVETLDDFGEGARLLEQGVYDVVVTAATVAAAGKPESLYQKINRLSPDARRRLFVILVADNLKTADGTQAFVLQGDLVVNARDVGSIDAALRSTLGDRSRLYQCYLDARRRFEAAAG
jgi:predicted Zn finger-like uncharacterized protein